MFKFICVFLLFSPTATSMNADADVETKTVLSNDGVRIVYSASGSGDTALVFVHGGLANRTFYDRQLKELGGRYRVIALDLPGHGQSGSNRKQWGIKQFAADVQAVVNAEQLKKVVLLGNSLGGPVVVEAALLLQGRVIGVIGIDTFQRIPEKFTEDQAQQLAARVDGDYQQAIKLMVKGLLHEDADPSLLANAESRMQDTPQEAAKAILLSLANYQPAAAARKLKVPLRAINGDLFPNDVDSVKKIQPNFELVEMKKIGHYPMLERPDEFNRHVVNLVQKMVGETK